MNRNFINYATGMAFSIQLSKGQIRALIIVSAPKNSASRIQYVQPKSFDSLISKGLIEHKGGKGLILTKPGELTVQLLKEAGLIQYDRHQLLSTKFVEDIHQEFASS